MATLFDDPQIARQLRDIIAQISANMGGLAGSIDRITNAGKTIIDQSRNIEELAANTALEAAKSRDEMEKTVESAIALKLAMQAAADAAKIWDDQVNEGLKSTFEKTLDKMKLAKVREGSARSLMDALVFGQDNETSSITGKVGGTLKGVQKLIGGAQAEIFQNMPSGGWLGFLLMGMNENMKDDALSNKIAHKFRQVSDVSTVEIMKLKGVLQNVQHAQFGFYDEKDLVASNDALVAGGYGIADAMAPYESSLTGIRSTVAEAGAIIDKTFSLNGGTAAKAIADFANSSGQSLTEATQQIEKLAVGARLTGTNFATLLGVMQQVTTATRFNGKEVSNLVNLYSGLQNVGSKKLGMTDAGSSQLGMQVLGAAATNVVDRLSDGMKAVLGGDIAEAHGIKGGGGGANIFRMLTGFRTTEAGKNGGIDTNTEAINFALKRANTLAPGTDDESMFARTKIISKTLGTSDKDSAILAMMEKISGGQGLVDEKNLSEAQRKELHDIKERLKDQMTPTERLLHDLKSIFQLSAQILIQMLGFIASTIGHGFQMIYNMATLRPDLALRGAQHIQNNALGLGNTLNTFLETVPESGRDLVDMIDVGLGNNTWVASESLDPAERNAKRVEAKQAREERWARERELKETKALLESANGSVDEVTVRHVGDRATIAGSAGTKSAGD